MFLDQWYPEEVLHKVEDIPAIKNSDEYYQQVSQLTVIWVLTQLSLTPSIVIQRAIAAKGEVIATSEPEQIQKHQALKRKERTINYRRME